MLKFLIFLKIKSFLWKVFIWKTLSITLKIFSKIDELAIKNQIALAEKTNITPYVSL